MMFSSIQLDFDAFSFPLCAYHFFLLLVTKCILNSTELQSAQNIKLYHFHRSILSSIPFCPIPFCPYTILSIPFCPYHFVRYHFVRSPSGTLPTQHGYCVRVSRRSVTGNCSEGVSKGLYVAASAGFEPTTLWSTAIDSTNERTRPTTGLWLWYK